MDRRNIELLRFTTAGSVDDGKSTLMEGCYMIVNRFFKINLKQLKNQVKQQF